MNNHRIIGLIKNDYSLSIVSKILTALIGVVSSAFSTRYLGIQYKGDYAYISHVANIIVLVLNLGIYQSYSYNYKRYGKEIIKKYTDICFFQFVILILVMIIMLITIKNPLLCMIMLLVPFNVLKLQYGNIVLIENFRLSLWLTVLNSLLTAICYIILYTSASPNILWAVMVVVTIDIFTIVAFFVKLKIIPQIWQVDFSFFYSVLKFGFIPMLSALLATINYSIDIVFLKKIGLPEELSYYSLAANIVNYVWLVPDAFKSVLFSKSAKKFDLDNIKFSSQMSTLFILMCLLGFAAFGKPIISILYGSEFIYSYGPTLLLILGAFSMSYYKLLGVVLVSQGKRMAHFVSLAISAVCNLILNSLLIPKIGMYGAGIASVCSYSICGFGLVIYFCRIYSVNPLQLMLPSAKTISSIKHKFVR